MKLKVMRVLSALVLLASSQFIFAGSLYAEGVMVEDPWIRAAPPNAPALAAFMVLNNHSGSEVALTDVEAPASLGRVELHRTSKEDGMMKMVQQKDIPISAHGSTTLKPGSWHIMMIQPEKVPSVGEHINGEHIKLTLGFSDGSKQSVIAEVRRGGMMMQNHNMMK